MLSTPQLYLLNYDCSRSSGYATHTQIIAYRGVEEAAGFSPLRSVTSLFVEISHFAQEVTPRATSRAPRCHRSRPLPLRYVHGCSSRKGTKGLNGEIILQRLCPEFEATDRWPGEWGKGSIGSPHVGPGSDYGCRAFGIASGCQ
jgi:hypothetical protein